MKIKTHLVQSAQLESFLQTYEDLGVPATVVGVDTYKPFYTTASDRGGGNILRIEAQLYCVVTRGGE